MGLEEESVTNEQWVDYIWKSVINMYGQRWTKEEMEMSKVELLKELDPEKVEAWDKLHDKRKVYRCERCGAEWKCEYADNKFGNLYANDGDSGILCQCCGFPTVKEAVFRGADGHTAVGGGCAMNKIVYVPFELDDIKAFHILCEVLGIKELVLSEENLFIHNGAVCRKNEKGEYEEVDERADLFAALRNVACAHWPNLEFRGDDYITNYRDGEEEEAEWEDCIVRGTPSIRCSYCGHESVYEDRYCGGCGSKMKNGY